MAHHMILCCQFCRNIIADTLILANFLILIEYCPYGERETPDFIPYRDSVDSRKYRGLPFYIVDMLKELDPALFRKISMYILSAEFSIFLPEGLPEYPVYIGYDTIRKEPEDKIGLIFNNCLVLGLAQPESIAIPDLIGDIFDHDHGTLALILEYCRELFRTEMSYAPGVIKLGKPECQVLYFVPALLHALYCSKQRP